MTQRGRSVTTGEDPFDLERRLDKIERRHGEIALRPARSDIQSDLWGELELVIDYLKALREHVRNLEDR